jgi:ABC-type transporter Mla subunit MlaD
MRRVERHPRAAGVSVLVFALIAAVVSTLAVNGLPFAGGGHRLTVALPAEAPLLRAGDEVRIAGQRVGTVKAVAPGSARLELDRDPGDRRHARIRLRGMAGAVYVELSAGAPATEASVDIPHVVAAFDASTRAALARTLRGAGGLAGRGDELNDALGVTPDALISTTPLLRAARPAATLVRPADRVVRALGAPGDLGALASGAADTGAPLADEADALGAAVGALPALENRIGAVLPKADPVLADAAAATGDLEPAVAALARALPAARGLERDAGKLAEASSLLTAARPVLQRGRSVLARDARWAASTLRPISRSAGVLARAIVPYAFELVDAPLGFERWGGFRYDEGQGKGHKAVRFTMVFTCQTARDPYPAPGAAVKERERCR